jgi:hypothetical protein
MVKIIHTIETIANKAVTEVLIGNNNKSEELPLKINSIKKNITKIKFTTKVTSEKIPYKVITVK